MKTKNLKRIFLAGMAGILSTVSAQITQQEKHSRAKLTVLNIDTRGVGMDPMQMGNLVRIEMDKLDTFEVMDRYDASYLIEKNQLKTDNCYGKLCLLEIAKLLKPDKILTGSVELLGESILVTIRLIDVRAESIEKTQVVEFVNIPGELPNMISITVRKMFGMHNDNFLLSKLTKRYDYESLINNPKEDQLRLNGTRMGCTIFAGQTVSELARPKSEGGFDIATPEMFQFGYQFERQYLNAGQAQALFEFIPMVSGLDHGLLIPSLTIMNGIRDNHHGWEFAFGPTVSVVTKATGYYSADGQWHLQSDYNESLASGTSASGTPGPVMIQQLDSRGQLTLDWGFVFAFGRTFKSGKLNLPVNIYVVTNSDGVRFGASFGFNAKNK